MKQSRKIATKYDATLSPDANRNMNATNYVENNASIRKSQRVAKKSQSKDVNVSPDDEI